MGFRGEALASIASVSRLSIASRAPRRGARQRHARRRRRSCGAIEPAARAPGTTVTVADLYFNTPARRKFLRTEATEFGHCDEVFRRIALARPGIAFTLKHNGRVSRLLRAQPRAGARRRDPRRGVLRRERPGRRAGRGPAPLRPRRHAAGGHRARRLAVLLRQRPLRARPPARARRARGLRRAAARRARSRPTCCSSSSTRAASTSTSIPPRPRCASATRAPSTSSCCTRCKRALVAERRRGAGRYAAFLRRPARSARLARARATCGCLSGLHVVRVRDAA